MQIPKFVSLIQGPPFPEIARVSTSEVVDYVRETNAVKGNLAVALLAIVVAFCTDSRGYEFSNELVYLFEDLFRYSYWYMSWI